MIHIFGSTEQKAKYLRRISSTEDDGTWIFRAGCGSEQASLKARAARDGDDWVMDGQEDMVTYGQYAYGAPSNPVLQGSVSLRPMHLDAQFQPAATNNFKDLDLKFPEMMSRHVATDSPWFSRFCLTSGT